MSVFKGQNAPKSISDGAPPQTPLGELTALPQTTIAVLKGAYSKGRGVREEGEMGKGRGGKGTGEGEGRERERGGIGTPAPQCGILATPLERTLYGQLQRTLQLRCSWTETG